MIAALYVATDGCYFGIPEVEPWDEERDARLYSGPHPVIAHPPCERWGNFAFGSPKNIAAGHREKLGDDGGCFAAALAAVRKWGGCLEHPARSRAWRFHGIEAPPDRGWMLVDAFGGYSCQVEQGHYGHRARKATWLYAVRTARPKLRWGPSSPPPMPRPNGGTQGSNCEVMGKQERLRTPIPFRNVLLDIVFSTRLATDRISR